MPRANIVALAARANPGNTGGDDDGLNGLKPRAGLLCAVHVKGRAWSG